MIPVFDPPIGEEEIAEVVAALRRGEISGSFGKSIPEFERLFADYVGCKYGIAVTSGTTALQLAVEAAGIGAGDEVLVSACTNIASALAVIYNNAVPVPVDSEPDTWNLDLDLVEKLLTPKTRAIMPVHIYGHPVDMERVGAIAKKHGLIVIEDCAESHGATVRGKMTGSFGDAGCFSFYANKVITTGEGGMVTTNDASLAEQLRLLRNLAFTEPRFRHEIAGHNFRMTGYQAAMGVAQMRKIDRIIDDKRRVAHAYNRFLSGVDALQGPIEREWAKNVYWMYGVVMRPQSKLRRADLMAVLKTEGIETRTFFCPMNLQPCLQSRAGWRQISCPVAENLWNNGFYLPSSPSLAESTIKEICDVIRAALT